MGPLSTSQGGRDIDQNELMNLLQSAINKSIKITKQSGKGPNMTETEITITLTQ